MIQPDRTERGDVVAPTPTTPGPPRGLRRGLLATPRPSPSSSSTTTTKAVVSPPPTPPPPAAHPAPSPSPTAGRGLRSPNSIDLLASHRLRSSWGRSPIASPSGGRGPELHGMIARISAVRADAGAASSQPSHGGGAGPSAWAPVLSHIQSHPSETVRLDSRGRSALHAACGRRPPPAIVSALLDATGRHGEAVAVQDNHGATPLSMAVEHGASVGCVRVLLKANPRAAGISDHVGKLPLHLACTACQHGDDEAKRRQVELVKLVLEAYPDGATKLNNKNRTPLHLAVEGGCRPEVVKMLVEARPEAVIMDECGSTPLALAIQHSSSVEIIRLLVKANPQVVRREDRSGLPLRKAIEFQAPAPVIELLCDCDPDSDSAEQTVLSVDSIGRTPLHLALQWSAFNFGVVRALLVKAPNAATMKNRQGLTPLTMAYQHYARTVRDVQDLSNLTGRSAQAWTAVLLMLRAARYGTVDDEIETAAVGGTTRREEPEWKVLHASLTTDVPLEVVRTALAMRPREVTEVDEEGRTALSLALVSPAYSKSRIVDLLLDAHPAAAQIPDAGDGGRYPLVQAANYGWLSGEVVHKLIQCYPDALHTTDVATGLYPFQVAAVPKGGGGRNGEAGEDDEESSGRRTTREMLVQWGWEADRDMLQTNAIFELLLAAPDLLMHGFAT